MSIKSINPELGGDDSEGEINETESVRLPTPLREAARVRSLVSRTSMPMDQQPALVYLARLAVGSRRTMSESLDIVAGLLTSNQCNRQTLQWSALRYQHTAALRALLAQLYAPATANKMLAAVRGVLQESWRLGQMSAEDYHRAADLPSVRGTTLPRGRALSHGELTGLFVACAKDKSAAGRRDAALLAVLYNCGLRRSELVGLDVGDYDPLQSALTVRSGKGNKARISYATDASMQMIGSWLKARGMSAGPLFTPVNKSGKVALRRLSDQAVRKILLKRASETGTAPFSPHDLRRTMIGDLLDAGADISTVQRMAGHANVTTTARYDRRGEAAKRKAAGLLNVPFASPDPPPGTSDTDEGRAT
jgi:site-specific recombinase XerD